MVGLIVSIAGHLLIDAAAIMLMARPTSEDFRGKQFWKGSVVVGVIAFVLGLTWAFIDLVIL